MSFNRKNWSALSSLARQRTLEDEEELERERRRRLRSLKSSISVEEEDLPTSPNASHPVPDRPQEADPPVAATPEEDEQKVSEVLKTEEVRQQRRQVTSISENVKEEKEPEAEAEAGPPEPAPRRLSAQVKVLAREFSKEQMDPRVDQHPESAPEPEAVEKEQHQQPASHEEEHRAEIAGQPPGSAQDQKGPIHLERKAVPRGERSVIKKLISPGASPSSQPDIARNPPRSEETARSVPASQEPEDSSVASHTTLGSLSRHSPRTLSFRVMSRGEKEESPLTRSASMRLPSSVKLEEKLQKYTSVVQRAELMRAPGAAQRGFIPSLESVASKRSIFEASATSRADQAPARKENLKIPNVVSSRINLWISRTQEPSDDSGAKDTGKMNSSAKHNLVTKWPKDSANDTKL